MIEKIITHQKMILNLAKNDFKKRYFGSFLGITWAFIQPLITILLFWFVFQVGFRNTPIDDVPFILWLSCAIIPWNFFAEAVQSSTNSIMENNFLIKKMVFKSEFLPVSKVYAALFVHLFFIVFLLVMFLIYGYGFSVYYLQVFYYLLASFVLILGLSWITSSLMVFLKDTAQVVAMLIQFGFWLTPIFYPITLIPEQYQYIYKLNPMIYITEGYRNTFIYHKWFWELSGGIYFWSFALIMLMLGFYLFKKMKPHFADVL
ncbi:ABC transporter permease [Paenibacillus sp. MER 180]|uniref:ABC transporter permease n=1 Tax=Paenibacillus TaxID=44249 RepID=UPI0020403886|nr:ABC transporter permease [Paenibacillus sp. MER 180]MCM3288528.1 ABC transporter permease [Paenibacillus sp. MER 180]